MPRWKRVWIVEQARKRGTTFRVCHLDEQGKRTYPASFWSERLAKEFRGKWELWLNGSGPKPLLEHGPAAGQHITGYEPRTWQQAVDEWLALPSPRRQKTQKLLRGNLEAFAKATGIATVDEVTTDIVATHLQGMARSAATVGQRLATLRQFFDWARKGNSPCTPELLAQWKPYRRHKRARPHYYTDAEFESIISACNTIKGNGYRSPLWWQTYLTLLHDCALRMNEASHLCWNNVNLGDGLVFIGPHNLPGQFDWRPKGTSTRTLPLTARAIDLLTRLHGEFAEEKVPYVFLTRRRYEEIKRDGVGVRDDLLHGIRLGFVRIRKTAGVLDGTIHDMRRTAITNWAKRTDLTPKDVQYLAGHADIKTTMDVYAMIQQGEVIERAKGVTPAPLDSQPSAPHPNVGT